ncbi:uncharacterized protein MONOS_18071 [Monocercomonoides exilis]|uniref:uncharacterized protein n=1 Tax=Monocercomonoides exilis TaxID=2049356 RepID=UPI00355A978D|nr:hypothetical protein MONOS_18071 [Monocercomonoides exilis]
MLYVKDMEIVDVKKEEEEGKEKEEKKELELYGKDKLAEMKQMIVQEFAFDVNESIVLEECGTQMLQYVFYFSRSGEFVHYPAQVVMPGLLCAAAERKGTR